MITVLGSHIPAIPTGGQCLHNENVQIKPKNMELGLQTVDNTVVRGSGKGKAI